LGKIVLKSVLDWYFDVEAAPSNFFSFLRLSNSSENRRPVVRLLEGPHHATLEDCSGFASLSCPLIVVCLSSFPAHPLKLDSRFLDLSAA
jgi:hypothetical protein